MARVNLGKVVPEKGVDYMTPAEQQVFVRDITADVEVELTPYINEKTSDFNDNATAKTTSFNDNASSKTNDFNTNATNKTGDFNDNASLKTTTFNSNATDKTTDFDSNATSKTNTFNTNATDKTTAFNNNAVSKTNDFNDYVESKKAEFDLTYEPIIDSNNKLSSDLVDDTNKTNKFVTASDKTNWNNKVDKDVNNLTNYELKTNTGSTIELSINSSTYVVTLNLKNSAGTVISTGTIDLPLESVVVNGSYDDTTKKVILTLQNGNTIEFSVADLVAGLQTEITSSNKLASDLVDDTNQTNKFVSSTDKSNWNAKYDKPSGGIPKTDLASDVQTSLGKADTAIQQHQDISGKEDKTNKVTSISSSSTDTQYPSAKCVYDLVGDIESILEELDIGGGV